MPNLARLHRSSSPSWPTHFLAACAAALLACALAWWSPQLAHAQDAVHVVAPGETLSIIARTHATDVSTLLRLNELRDPNVVRVGQRLRLPTPAGSRTRQDNSDTEFVPAPAAVEPGQSTRVYVVRAGDTLNSLAQRFATTPAALAALNRLAPATRLNIGEPLRVPAATATVPTDFTMASTSAIPVPGPYVVHTVQPGESLAAIAEVYGTSLRELTAKNDVRSAGRLEPGLRLLVPPPSYAQLFTGTPRDAAGVPQYPTIPTTEKWISVDLTHQRAYAWEDNKLVKSFAISSGKSRTPTVTGVFRIWAKVPAQTMEGGSRAAGDYYNLPGVQWVQYFYRDYSFHGTYWHNNFGVPMSHGCVNMRNADAEWLYNWADPHVDEHKWHILEPDALGTLVIIHY